MEENVRVIAARYQKIAADIAAKIVDHHYQIGEKIYARSLIASQYSVSSETARKAIAILADLKIVDTVKGSGVIIKSYENAVDFLRRFRDAETMVEIKQDAVSCLGRLTKDGNDLREAIDKLVDHTNRLRALNPLAPVSVLVEEGMLCVGKTISDLNFWQNTAATVVAIRRGDTLLRSPGPYAELLAGDTLYFIGDESCIGRVDAFLKELITESSIGKSENDFSFKGV